MASKENSLEQVPLIVKADTPPPRTCCSHPVIRYGCLLPMLFFTVLGTQLMMYTLTEWTQYKLKVQSFPNATKLDNHCSNQSKSDPNYEKFQEVQRESAQWTMAYSFCELLPAIFALLFLPSFMDSFGRKYLLVLTMGGVLIKSVNVTLVIYYNAPFGFVLIGCLIVGLSGSIFAAFTSTNAMVADITEAGNQRMMGLIVTEFSIFIASVIGSFISGYLIGIGSGEEGFVYCSLIGASFCGIAFVFVFFVPESLPKEKRSKRKPIGVTLKRMVDFYISSEYKGKRSAFILLFLALFFSLYCNVSRGSIETLYLLGRPFCWNSRNIAVFLMVRSALTGLAGLGSIRLLQRCLSNPTIAIFSITSTIVSYFIEAFANTAVLIYLVAVTSMFSFVATPIISSLMSSMAPMDQQGSLFAGVSVSAAIATLIASLSLNSIYAATVSIMNGFVFLVLGAIAVIDVMFMVAYKCLNKDLQLNVDIEVKVDTEDEKPIENGVH